MCLSLKGQNNELNRIRSLASQVRADRFVFAEPFNQMAAKQ
jgi:hypothetical protein